MKLNNASIRALQPAAQDYKKSDGQGLYVWVYKTGSKAFAYRYTYGRNRKWMILGSYPAMGLQDARMARFEQKKLRQAGKDPGALKEEARLDLVKAISVKQLGEEFFDKFLKVHYQKPDEAYARLKADPIAVLGKTLVRDVTPKQIIGVFDAMVARGAKVGANRTLALTRKMFDFAVKREHISVSPVTITPKDAGGREVSCETNLLFTQINELLGVLNALPLATNGSQRGLTLETVMALKLILGTGKRPMEVATMEWAHVNLDHSTWFNPKHLTKEKYGDHLVFLNKWTVDLLKILRATHPESSYVLPSVQKKKGKKVTTHITVRSLSRAVLKLRNKGTIKLNFSPHDLRRTFSSRAADLKVAAEVVEKCLDHKMTGTMAVYNRASYFEERKAAMDLWGVKLEELDVRVQNLDEEPARNTQAAKLNAPLAAPADASPEGVSGTAADQATFHADREQKDSVRPKTLVVTGS
jgi:integrase